LRRRREVARRAEQIASDELIFGCADDALAAHGIRNLSSRIRTVRQIRNLTLKRAFQKGGRISLIAPAVRVAITGRILVIDHFHPGPLKAAGIVGHSGDRHVVKAGEHEKRRESSEQREYAFDCVRHVEMSLEAIAEGAVAPANRPALLVNLLGQRVDKDHYRRHESRQRYPARQQIPMLGPKRVAEYRAGADRGAVPERQQRESDESENGQELDCRRLRSDLNLTIGPSRAVLPGLYASAR
jgi:hypothetical protein